MAFIYFCVPTIPYAHLTLCFCFHPQKQSKNGLLNFSAWEVLLVEGPSDAIAVMGVLQVFTEHLLCSF